MNKRVGKKSFDSTAVLFLGVIFLMALAATVYYEKTHPEFDEKLSGKEATVISEVATIHYEQPYGRNTDTVIKSQKVELTGRMSYVMQSDIIHMEICLEDGSIAWILNKDIIISE